MEPSAKRARHTAPITTPSGSGTESDALVLRLHSLELKLYAMEMSLATLRDGYLRVVLEKIEASQNHLDKLIADLHYRFNDKGESLSYIR